MAYVTLFKCMRQTSKFFKVSKTKSRTVMESDAIFIVPFILLSLQFYLIYSTKDGFKPLSEVLVLRHLELVSQRIRETLTKEHIVTLLFLYLSYFKPMYLSMTSMMPTERYILSVGRTVGHFRKQWDSLEQT